MKLLVKEAYVNNYFTHDYTEEFIFSVFISTIGGLITEWTIKNGENDLKGDISSALDILFDRFRAV